MFHIISSKFQPRKQSSKRHHLCQKPSQWISNSALEGVILRPKHLWEYITPWVHSLTEEKALYVQQGFSYGDFRLKTDSCNILMMTQWSIYINVRWWWWWWYTLKNVLNTQQWGYNCKSLYNLTEGKNLKRSLMICPANQISQTPTSSEVIWSW
jgi:hypothetical protein